MAEASAAPAAGLPTAIIYDDVFLEHDTGFGHPESPLRYQVVMQALARADFAGQLQLTPARAAADEDLIRCHDPGYVETARRDIQSGASALSTGDTAVCPASWKAARHAAGGACLAVDLVLQNKAKNVFCALRPPGHHATARRGMGFCVFNNVAVAARYAQQRFGVGKVLIADWDVHHANGTQDIFYEDGSVFLFSTHQSPWYPGTGAREETGRGPGLGTTLNRPFPAGAGRHEIVGAFVDELRPAMDAFQPELVLLSAGFDSRHGDPLGGFHLADEDFADLTQIMLEIADRSAHGRVISMLEGGYELSGLALAVTAHCRVLAAHHSAATAARPASEQQASTGPPPLTTSLGPPEEWWWW